MKVNKLLDMMLVVVSVIVLIWTLLSLPYDFPTIWKFLQTYVGPTAVLLVPMAIFILAVTLLLPFGRLKSKDLTAEVVQVIFFLAPLLGFIGTLLGFASGTLGFKHGFDTKAVAQMAVRTGQGISSTLFGIVIFAVSGLIIRYGIEESPGGSRALREGYHEG